MTKSLLLVATLLLVFAAPTAAHVTVTVDPLTAPVQVGVPTNVTVRFSEPCFEMPIEAATGNDQLTAALAATAPSYVSGFGATVPWTLEECDPSEVPVSYARQAATLTIVMDPRAPGLTNISIPVTYVNANGESSEGVPLNVTVAHYGTGTLAAALRNGTAGAHGGAHGKAIGLILNYTTNAESLLTFEAASSSGEVHEIDAIAVTPPAFDNKSSAQVEAAASFMPSADWTSANLTFTAYLTPLVGGPKVEIARANLTLANHEVEHDHDDVDGHHDEAKDTPSPAFALVGLALLAFAARRR